MTSGSPTGLKIGDRLHLDVQRLGRGTDALCRVDSFSVFVPGALPGERIHAEIASITKGNARARLLAVESRSPDRVDPACRHFGECDGCRLQHLAAPTRLAHKLAAFRRLAVARLASKPELPEPVAPSDWQGERTRIAMRFERHGRAFHGGLPDLFGRGILPIEECPATDPTAWRIAMAVRQEALARQLHALRAVVVQASSDREHAHVTLVSEAARLPHAQRLAEAATAVGATGVSLNIHDVRPEHLLGRRTVPLLGRPTLHERIDDVELRLTATTHTEGVREGARLLVAAVRRAAVPSPVGTVIDLFSGSGLLALAVAHRATRVIGIDHNIAAVHDAEAGASASGLSASFRHQKVLEALPSLERPRPDVVILDPPRAGFDDDVAAGVARVLAPAALCVVGREPGTLGRDLLRFEALGFRVERIETIDSDPQLPDLLGVARLVRD